MSKRNYLAGPNCWNAAFYASGMYPYLIQMSGIQANNLYAANCRRVKTSIAQAAPGALVRITKDSEDTHSFIKFDASRAFEKEGFLRDQPYQVRTAPQTNKALGCDTKKGCRPLKYAVYSCTPKIPVATNPLEIALHTLAKEISKYIFDQRNARTHLQRVNAASGELARLMRHRSFTTWVAQASKTNLLIGADIYETVASLLSQEEYGELNHPLERPGTAIFEFLQKIYGLRTWSRHEHREFERFRFSPVF